MRQHERRNEKVAENWVDNLVMHLATIFVGYVYIEKIGNLHK